MQGGCRPLPTPEELLARVGRAYVVVMAELAELFGPWARGLGTLYDPPLLQVYPPQGDGSARPVPLGPHVLFPFLSWLDQSPRDQHPPTHTPGRSSVTGITLNFVQKGLAVPQHLYLPPSLSCLWLCVRTRGRMHTCVFSSVHLLHKIFIECPLGTGHCC